MSSVRRRPHVYPEDRWLFLTWHLHGALRTSQIPPPSKASSGEAFLLVDRQLDGARSGPMFLRQDAIASLVAKSLHQGVELGHYELGSWVIMANHVHALLLPKVPGRPINEVVKRLHRPPGEPNARQNRHTVLAERILRSLGARRS
jgi:hypothetical protein